MSDYYEHAAQVDLAKPVVLSGYLSDFTRSVAYRASALLGLPFHDIDRLVEHEIGQDIGKILLEEGERAYREVEELCLGRALRDEPYGLVALGDGGLLKAASLQRVLGQGRLVVLDLDLPNLYWRAQNLARTNETSDWHPLYEGSPTSVDEIRPFYQERRSGFERADLRVDANIAGKEQACDQLIRWIQVFGI